MWISENERKECAAIILSQLCFYVHMRSSQLCWIKKFECVFYQEKFIKEEVGLRLINRIFMEIDQINGTV